MTQKIRSMIQGFEDEVLEACLELSIQEKADNARFVDEALSILERTDGSIPYARLMLLSELSIPIIEQVESGASPKWSNRLARMLADPRFSPVTSNPSLTTESAEITRKLFLSYAIKWAHICIAMDTRSHIVNLEDKRSIIRSIVSLLLWIEEVDFDTSKITEVQLDEFRLDLEDFLFTNRNHLDFNSNNFVLIASLLRRLPELVRPDWRGSPGTMKVYDLIPINKSDIPALSTHFGSWKPNFRRGSLYTAPTTETSEITPKQFSQYSHPDSGLILFVVSNVDNMSQTVDLCIYPELVPPTKPEGEGPSVEEIREWLVAIISKQEGFIRVSMLGHLWRKEHGISLREALKQTDLTPNILIQNICEETGDYFLTDREDAGGRIRRLGPNEDLSILSQFEPSTDESKKWLGDWGLPGEKSMANMLVKVSEDLYSLPVEEWDVLKRFRVSRFYTLIVTQAINTEKYKREKLRVKTDISPLGLLENMIEAIMAKCKRTDDDLDQEYLGEQLREIRGAAKRHLDQMEDDDLGEQLSWSSDMKPTRRLSLPMSKQKEAKRAEVEAKRNFGPVVSSAHLISDYLYALQQEPESLEDLCAHVNESYRNRVKSSRTRITGHKKSDEQVWTVSLSITSKSPEEVILELLRRAKIPKKKSLELVDKAKRIRNA